MNTPNETKKPVGADLVGSKSHVVDDRVVDNRQSFLAEFYLRQRAWESIFEDVADAIDGNAGGFAEK